MLKLTDVPLGWQLYLLIWLWLGIAAGFGVDTRSPILVTVLVWATGGTAGWLLTSTVQRHGWGRALRFLGALLVALFTLAQATNPDTAITDLYVMGLLPLFLVGLRRAVVVVDKAVEVLWRELRFILVWLFAVLIALLAAGSVGSMRTAPLISVLVVLVAGSAVRRVAPGLRGLWQRLRMRPRAVRLNPPKSLPLHAIAQSRAAAEPSFRARSETTLSDWTEHTTTASVTPRPVAANTANNASDSRAPVNGSAARRRHEPSPAIDSERAQSEALTDWLTGLPNARYLSMHLTREFARAGRQQSEISIMVLELDNLNDIRENDGRRCADQALCAVARIVGSHIRPFDICARYDGGTFVVAMSGLGAEESDKQCEALRPEFDAVTFEEGSGKGLGIDVSIGSAVFPGDGDSGESLLAVADSRRTKDKEDRARQSVSDALARDE